MDLKLKGNLALVTGSTSGIGKGIAKAMLKEGVRVVINSFSIDEIEHVKSEMEELGEAYFITGDITDTDSVTQMMDAVYKIGDLDIIVNNVGFWEPCEFQDISDDDWNKVMNMNFYGAVRTLRYCMPRMLKRNYGRIINISSEVAFKPLPDMVHYSVAKTAVLSLSRALAEVARGKNVTVNSILPGPTWTEGEAASQKKLADAAGITLDQQIKDFFNKMEPSSLAERFLDIDEVVNTVLYYCSPIASANTGASVRVDGGIIRHI